MIRCWILIGGNGVRKGSVVRALTGIGNGRDCQIALRNGQYLHLAIATVSSINEREAPNPDQWVSSQENGINQRIKNLLVCFQINGQQGFDAEDYIRSLDNSGADIRSIVTLGESTPSWVPRYGAPYASIPDSMITPTAITAAMVRTLWDWA